MNRKKTKLKITSSGIGKSESVLTEDGLVILTPLISFKEIKKLKKIEWLKEAVKRG